MKFRDYSFGEWLRFIGVDGGIIVLVVALPFAKLVPYWFGHENGPIEIMQNFVLLLGVLMALRFFALAQNIAAKHTWLTIIGFLLLCLGRELSWGRVFFFTHYDTSGGPVFLDLKDLPGHILIYALIVVLIVAVLYGLVRHIPYRRLFAEHRQWPIAQIAMMIIFAVLSQISEHSHGDTIMASETAEELFELWSYILFIGVIYELRPLFSGETYLNSRQIR